MGVRKHHAVWTGTVIFFMVLVAAGEPERASLPTRRMMLPLPSITTSIAFFMNEYRALGALWG